MSDHNRWNIQQSPFADRNKIVHCAEKFPLFVYFASLEWVITIAEIFNKVLLQTETKPFIALKSFHCSFILPRWNEWSQSLKYSAKSFCRQKQNRSLCWKVSTVRLFCLTGMSDHNRWNIQQSPFADRNKTFHCAEKFPLFVYFASLEWVITIAEIVSKVLLQTETKPFITLTKMCAVSKIAIHTDHLKNMNFEICYSCQI